MNLRISGLYYAFRASAALETHTIYVDDEPRTSIVYSSVRNVIGVFVYLRPYHIGGASTILSWLRSRSFDSSPGGRGYLGAEGTNLIRTVTSTNLSVPYSYTCFSNSSAHRQTVASCPAMFLHLRHYRLSSGILERIEKCDCSDRTDIYIISTRL